MTTRYATLNDPTKTREYRAWINMRSRCYNSRDHGYKNYGGRGIMVCNRWLVGESGQRGYECFIADMGPRPSAAHSLDRIDPNGNYEPINCRWALPVQQSRNKRLHHFVEIDGKRVTLADAVERAPVPYNTVLYRLKRGWRIADAVSRPARKGLRP